MPKRPEDFEQFSIEEIIAEIKSEAGETRPPKKPAPVHSEPANKSSEPEPKPTEGTKKTGDVKIFDMPPAHTSRASASAKPKESQKPLRPTAAKPTEHTVERSETGKRMREEEKTRAQRILEDEEQLQNEQKRRSSAPWRTKGKKPAHQPSAGDTQEFSITLEIDASGKLPPGDEEASAEPGPEPAYDFLNQPYTDAGAAVRALDKCMVSLAVRILLLLPLLVTAFYMTICMPLGLPMPFGFTYFKYPFIYLLVFAALHVAALIISADVTAAGLMRIIKLRPTMDSLTLFGQLCVLAHNVSIILRPEWGGWLPYTSVAIFTCLIAMVAKRQRAESLRRTYRATLLGTVPAAVKIVREGEATLAVKTEEGAYIDIDQLAAWDPTERASRYFSPLAIAACVGLAVSASIGQKRPESFFWCLAAISAMCSPASLLISSSMPMRRLSKKLFTSGSGLINPVRTKKLAKAGAIVLRDGDIFPVGAVEISGMKIAGTQKMETVLGCAAAVAQEIGGGLSRALTELARRQYVPPGRASNLRFYESGGLSAEVDGKYVLMGSASFLMRMGVPVSEGVKLQSSIFIALQGVFAGIFSLKYGVQPQPYSAFRILRGARILPIIATRDINISQAYVESRFELRADSTEYPDLLERIRLSEYGFGGKEETLAFISRDGMLPFAEAVSAAKKQCAAVRLNLVVGIGALVIGMMLMYFLAFNMKASAATPSNALLYLLLWLVPTVVGSTMLTKL